jgi:hypothetical protein
MEIKKGDRVYHKTEPSIIWIVEEVLENYEFLCKTFIKETFEEKEKVFSASVISKEATGDRIVFGSNPKRNNHW